MKEYDDMYFRNDDNDESLKKIKKITAHFLVLH